MKTPKISGLNSSLGPNNNNEKQAAKKSVKTKLVKQVVNILKQGVEKKYFDQYASSTLTNAGYIACITDVTRGTDVTQRVGNQITFTGLDLRLYTKIAVGIDAQTVRVLLVLDTFGTNAPNFTDILESAFIGSTYTQNAPYYWDYRKRFRILHDHVHALNENSNQSENVFRHIKMNIVSQNIGASTTFKNQIYILLVSNESNLLALPVYWYTTRLYFTDE